MAIEGNFNQSPKHVHHGDASLPDFHFLAERPKMLLELMRSGMTQEQAEAEIQKREHNITNKQAQAKLDKNKENRTAK
jgi:hypothetical protein